jgi:phytol kinase
MTHADLLSVAAVFGVVVLLLVLLRVLKRFVAITPEQVRKMAHIGTGALAMSFPWIFSSPWAVCLVCSLAALLMAGIQYFPPLQSRLGGVLHSVGRTSRGDLYFPISVALLFVLARGNKLLYVVPILVLTLADSMAALLGEQYGKHGYSGIGGIKSMEGSVGFFTVAFFSVHVPLLLFTQLGRPETLLIAADIGLVVTLLEAIAWRGLDNIFIPLGVFILLHIYTAMPVSLLLARLIVAIALLLFVALYRSRTTLEASALLAAVLVLYTAWGLGGWRWLLAPATLLVTYPLFHPGKLLREDRTHNVYAVISAASSGLVWVFIAQSRRGDALLFPYTLGYAIQLALLAWTLSVAHRPEREPWKFGPLLVTQSCILMLAPWAFEQHFSRTALLECGIAWALSGTTFVIFCAVERRTEGLYSVGPARWARQALLGFLITLAGAGIASLL